MYTEKGQRTRDHLIEVSAALFNKKGYAGTSVSDILDTAGYSKGALYRTFADKDELSHEAFKYNLSIMNKLLQDAIDKEDNYIDKVLAIPRYYKNIETNKFLEGGCPVLNTAIEADDTNYSLNKLASNAFKDWALMIEDNIRIGQANGGINKTVDAKKISIFIIATIEGSIAMVRSLQDYSVMKNNINILETLVLKEL